MQDLRDALKTASALSDVARRDGVRGSSSRCGDDTGADPRVCGARKSLSPASEVIKRLPLPVQLPVLWSGTGLEDVMTSLAIHGKQRDAKGRGAEGRDVKGNAVQRRREA